ncbi:MAG: hypothetical protein UY92_C0015G0005 [Candidatus Magasanikbacteria bacterium GW2011_GWA2_56_11]|uniref:Uncharacterized protein n=1 Tax=Candidatus Magasanikbacteria bacterium GW2011_GWA2_56_11 TaxID=1619044 RepID=A0A0G1YDL8_9BACT|nr:MAG: hypothetical protein UY92_C0015G0005 [Candidatus Magasanikbacteria bacterium GW2011_GWA2_56_11]
MKLHFSGLYAMNPRQLIRRAGYGEIINRTGAVSYARVFGPSGYPRFHAYLELAPGGFEINLHLDQKKPTYGTGTAHSGEYDGDAVEREGGRIQAVIASLKRPTLA